MAEEQNLKEDSKRNVGQTGAKIVPRGSKEISNILGERRSSYNVDGFDRVVADEIADQKQVGIPLIDKIVIVLVVFFTLLVFINFSFTSNDAKEDADIDKTLFITKIIELVILILFVLEISIRCITVGFITYFSDLWSVFDALIIIASIVLIILDLNLEGDAFTTISKVLRGIFRFLRLFLVFRKFNQVKKINNAGARYVVRSPVEKVIEIMRDLVDQFEDPEIIKQLNWGITHISNNTVYEPIIEGRKSEALGWLNQPQQHQQISQDLKRSMSSDIQFYDESHLPEQLNQDFEQHILNLDYDYFSLFEKYDLSILTHLMCYYFQKEQLFSSLRISPESFKKCVDRLASSYHKENLYHNVIHAFDVTHTVYFFIQKCNFKEIGKLSKIDYSILLLSAAAHDVDHPGLNNIFLSNTRHELAMTYNDKSPLEQHHASTLFRFIREADLLTNFTLSDFKYFREKSINMILSTDNAMHGKDYNKLKARLASNDFDPGAKDKGICFDTLLHAADISNPFKPMKNYEKWTFRVLGEFWVQGDKEKELGLPITMLCDRRTTNVAKSQIGFIDFMVLPYYNTLAQILPLLSDYIDQITENKKAWAEKIEHYQTLLNTQ
ncbi:unnamed protein product (macronuclear) [Paramecium tetraurelia]|uniref:Phosphodiesterase n=1 Tax=Paramecium tetraurelia TaxID=5888 RepID=A0DXF6_PARTE|nr:uncharacterized protein GSPATT00021356001 [Paramecium tetraurelia]CAK87723.1 unnamed protein product [Paramecium tetraurelia]|eukprot:XP_001455120.1 hypothetical protein (macronuclear) [Paramecium tetraurelia strain d4-2]